MENNLENKAKFFALYWGQKVLAREGSLVTNIVGGDMVSIHLAVSDDNYHLELTPLSRITDEHTIEVGRIIYKYFRSSNGLNGDEYYLKTGKDFINQYLFEKRNYLLEEIVDYLRSKGYAMSWMDLRIEKLVEYSWIKLKIKKQ